MTAINPANGEEIPVWIADYVLAGYGTGAIMAVPGHDYRDLEFADKYKLPVVHVIDPKEKYDAGFFWQIYMSSDEYDEREDMRRIVSGEKLMVAYTGEGYVFNSGEFDGLTSEEAKQKITEFVGGEMKKTYRLRDWGISRQRYWGCPIPIVYDPGG